MSTRTVVRMLLMTQAEQASDLYRLVHSFTTIHCKVQLISSSEQARFFFQHDAADVLLLDDCYFDTPPSDWMVKREESSIVLLSDRDAEQISEALDQCVTCWLPLKSTLQHPVLLERTLRRQIRLIHRFQEMTQLKGMLHEKEEQVTRLTNLLWQVTPAHGLTRWHSQRYMLERLHEETQRAKRYDQPLSLLLGEVRAAQAGLAAESLLEGLPWNQEILHNQKRYSDVVGQYDTQGFVLLLPNTDTLGAKSCCERLARTFQQESEKSGSELRAGFGYASTTENLEDPGQLLSRAEERLSEALTL